MFTKSVEALRLLRGRQEGVGHSGAENVSHIQSLLLHGNTACPDSSLSRSQLANLQGELGGS